MVQWVVRAFGWVFVLIALWGFTASGGSMDADMATAPRIFGLFPVNLVHNLIHLAFGIWALIAYHWPRRARNYAMITGALYLGLALLGVFAPELFGLAPIGGNDIWLHVAIGVVLLGVGVTAQGQSAAVAEPHVEPRTGPGPSPASTTTASSPQATINRQETQPSGTEQHRHPVEPKPAHNEGAAPAAPPPSTPEHVVDEPPQQPGRGTRSADRLAEPGDPDRRPPDRGSDR